MRSYGKVAPQFWIGNTGRKLRDGGAEALLVAIYLISNPHANMLGLYYLPMPYISHETGLGTEGASEGLRKAVEAGFCNYDTASEVVFVYNMARFQVEERLEPEDKRCKGIQREYDALPANPFLPEFFKRYETAFHMTNRRGTGSPTEGASEVPRSQEHEQEHEQDQEQERAVGAAAPSPPARQRRAVEMPEDFKPTDEHRALAAELGVNLGSAFLAFQDHYLAKGSKFQNWDRALNGWLRREVKFAGGARTKGKGVVDGKPSGGQIVEREIAIVRARRQD